MFLQWSDADRVEVRVRGCEGDQAQVGSIVVVHGARFGARVLS